MNAEVITELNNADIPLAVKKIFQEMGTGYVYEHTNGTYHWKPFVVVNADPNYFDSPFVRKVWMYEP